MTDDPEYETLKERLASLRIVNERLAGEARVLRERIERLSAEIERLRANADAVLVAENELLRGRAERASWAVDVGSPEPQRLMALRRDNDQLEKLVRALHRRLAAAGIAYDLAVVTDKGSDDPSGP
jgi:hypothetical protein